MSESRSSLEVVAFTHRGCVRSENQDTIAVGDWIMSDSMSRPELFSLDRTAPALLLIADGMGGHRAGERASRFVSQRLGQAIRSRGSDAHAIEAGLQEINSALYDLMLTDPSLTGMGATVVGLCVTAEKTWLFNVGDSRGYRLQDGFLGQLSVDDIRRPTVDESGAHSKTGVITQSLGGATTFCKIAPHLTELNVRAGTVILLTSDGLTDSLTHDALEAAFSEDLHATGSRLIERAFEAAADDNVSFVIVRLS